MPSLQFDRSKLLRTISYRWNCCLELHRQEVTRALQDIYFSTRHLSGPAGRARYGPRVGSISPQTAQSSPRTRREVFFALCCFLLFNRRSLSVFCLGVLSAAGLSEEIPGDVQVLDALRLFRGRFIGHCMVPRFDNGLVEAFVTAVGVVTLFSTIVGLHDHGAGLCGYIAGPHDLAM
jgi:hypothetical protein